MQTAEIHRRWLDFFAAARSHRRPFRLAGQRRSVAAVHGGRHGAVRPVSHRPRPCAVPARDERAEVHPDARHRRGRQDAAPRHLLPDVRQLLVRRLLQGAGDHLRLGAPDHDRGRRRPRASIRRTSGSPCTRTTTRRARSGAASPGLPDERIQGLGKDTNYWSTGQPGPAGPCSEIFFDRGPAYGIDGGPATDDDRYVEIWNLVFMQYLRGEGTGKADFEILGDLPKKNIDTGMGLERVAFLKQGVENMYEIDQVRPVLDRAAAARRQDVRCGPRGRRAAARHRRPRAQRAHADVRRGHARRTRAAATSCDACCVARCGPCACSASTARSLPGAVPRVARRDEGGLPRGRRRLRAHLAARLRRRGDVPAHARRGHGHPRHRCGEHAAVGSRGSSRATRPSSCTTRTASRSTSPSRWPRKPGSASTAPRSTA